MCCVQGPSHVGNGILAREGMLDMIIAMADSGSAVHVVSSAFCLFTLPHSTLSFYSVFFLFSILGAQFLKNLTTI